MSTKTDPPSAFTGHWVVPKVEKKNSISSCPQNTLLRNGRWANKRNTTTLIPRRRARFPSMLIPPAHYNVPLSDEDKGPKGYKWDPNYPGTLKPGSVPDNYPLEDVLNSDVYENIVYEEWDIDERHPSIYEQQVDEDFLEWLDKQGRLIPRDSEDEDMFEPEAGTQASIPEDDLDYADDDSKMIAYYSRNSNGASSDFDFGGFSESTFDYDAGY